MKILSITNDIDSGGAAKSLFALARSLVELGHSMRIITISPPNRTQSRVEQLLDMGVQVDTVNIPYYPMSLVSCPIPFWKNVGRAISRSGEFRRLKRLVAEFEPSVVHYNSYTTLLASLPLAEYPGVLHAREILLENSMLLGPTRQLVRSRMKEVVAISPAEAEQVARCFDLPVSTVFNSSLAQPRFETLPRSEGLVYGVFSHVSPMKGHMVCIEACAKVAEKLRNANVRIKIFGGKIGIHEKLYDSIQDQIESLGVEDIVSFQGFSANPEEEMGKINLILRPDLAGHPWGRDVLEAMSLGRPVLATGTRETFVKSGQTGMLVPAGDVDAFANAMVELADPVKLEKMGRNAYEFASRHFDSGQNGRKVLECLEQAAE